MLTNSNKTRMIIPCAGFGTRVGMQPNQSKELLVVNGKPLIEFSLDLAKKHDCDPLIITRKEKTDLIQYCIDNKLEFMVLNTPGTEWANTVMLSMGEWRDNNLLVFPDTTWDNTEVIDEMIRDLKIGSNVSFGVFSLTEDEEASKWSTISDYWVHEKTSRCIDEEFVAWGIIAFKKAYGEKLFLHLTRPRYGVQLEKASFQTIKNFVDLTREKR